MLRKDVLIHKSRILLDEFLAPMLGQVDKPRKRFLKQTVRGVLGSAGKPVPVLTSSLNSSIPVSLLAQLFA